MRATSSGMARMLISSTRCRKGQGRCSPPSHRPPSARRKPVRISADFAGGLAVEALQEGDEYRQRHDNNDNGDEKSTWVASVFRPARDFLAAISGRNSDSLAARIKLSLLYFPCQINCRQAEKPRPAGQRVSGPVGGRSGNRTHALQPDRRAGRGTRRRFGRRRRFGGSG